MKFLKYVKIIKIYKICQNAKNMPKMKIFQSCKFFKGVKMKNFPKTVNFAKLFCKMSNLKESFRNCLFENFSKKVSKIKKFSRNCQIFKTSSSTSRNILLKNDLYDHLIDLTQK